MLFKYPVSLKNKILRIVQRLAIELIDPFFSDRHPNKYIIRLTEALSFLILYFQPNDRWNLHIFVKEWTKIFYKKTEIRKKNIFMFSCYRGQFSRDILLAIILAKKGHKITLTYLPKLRGPSKSPLKDSNGVQEYLNYVMNMLENRSKGKIKCINLTEYYSDENTDNSNFYKQAHSDTVMMLKKENINLEKTSDKKTFEFCLVRLKFINICITNFFKSNNNFDLCLIANGASFENSQILLVAKNYQIPFNTFEKFAFKNAITVDHNSSFVEFRDLDILINLVKKNQNEHEKIKHKIESRSRQLLLDRKQSTGRYWGQKYQKSTYLDKTTKNWLFNKTNNEKFVLICPNVPFDAGYGTLNTVFSTMKEWLLETIKFILNNSDLFVIVRAHPAEDREGFGNEKTDIIIKNANINSDRLIVISSSSTINTYELMNKCYFSSVYSSTTGVEIAMSGKLVVAGANIYHSRVGISKGASDLGNYIKILKQLINGSIKKTDDDVYAATLVYFLFHFVLQYPYPYDKPSEMVKYPINKFFYEPEFSKYDLTFELLTKNEDEYSDFFNKNIGQILHIWN